MNDNLKKNIDGLKNFRINPDNDTFDNFKQVAFRKKRKRFRIASLSIAAAIIPVLFLFQFFGKESNYTLNDFCENSTCLCDKSFNDLQNKGILFKEVLVKNDCYENCSECRIGTWYATDRFKGVVIQKAGSSDEILRIRFTKEFKGKLPDGSYIRLDKTVLKDLGKLSRTGKWQADNCSGYITFTNGDIRILVKSEKTVLSGPADLHNNVLSQLPVEAIEMINSCMNNS